MNNDAVHACSHHQLIKAFIQVSSYHANWWWIQLSCPMITILSKKGIQGWAYSVFIQDLSFKLRDGHWKFLTQEFDPCFQHVLMPLALYSPFYSTLECLRIGSHWNVGMYLMWKYTVQVFWTWTPDLGVQNSEMYLLGQHFTWMLLHKALFRPKGQQSK